MFTVLLINARNYFFSKCSAFWLYTLLHHLQSYNVVCVFPDVCKLEQNILNLNCISKIAGTPGHGAFTGQKSAKLKLCDQCCTVSVALRDNHSTRQECNCLAWCCLFATFHAAWPLSGQLLFLYNVYTAGLEISNFYATLAFNKSTLMGVSQPKCGHQGQNGAATKSDNYIVWRLNHSLRISLISLRKPVCTFQHYWGLYSCDSYPWCHAGWIQSPKVLANHFILSLFALVVLYL